MPDPRVIEERTASRSTVMRRALILTPSAIVLLILLTISSTYLPYSFLAVAVLALGGIPAAFEAVSALRDLRAEPTTTTGTINRLWKKSRFMLIGRVDYALVDGQLFELRSTTAMDLRDGDRVIIDHWPHTNTVISLALAARETNPPSRRR